MTGWIARGFGFALMVAYWPGIAGVATTPRWDVASLLALALFFAPRIRMTAAHSLGIALFGWLLLSLIWTPAGDARLDGIDVASELLIGGIAFAVGSTMVDLRPVLQGAAVGIGVNGVIALMQAAGVAPDMIQTLDGLPAGLFYNPDRLGAAAAMVFVGTLSFRMWHLIGWVLAALIIAGSRAAWLAVFVVLLSFDVRAAITSWLTSGCPTRKQFCKIRWASRIVYLVAPLAALAICIVAFRSQSGIERLAIWRDTIANLNLFGHGLGSFRELYLGMMAHFDIVHFHTRPEHPHNEWLWLAFEGGVVAFVFSAAFAVSVWRESDGLPERAILAALFVLSLFASPFHDPATLVVGALCAGRVAGCRTLVFDDAVACRLPVRDGLAADAAFTGLV